MRSQADCCSFVLAAVLLVAALLTAACSNSSSTVDAADASKPVEHCSLGLGVVDSGYYPAGGPVADCAGGYKCTYVTDRPDAGWYCCDQLGCLAQ